MKQDQRQQQQQPVEYCAAVYSTTLQIIKDSARYHFGTKIQNHNHKPYITTEKIEYIQLIRYKLDGACSNNQKIG